MAQQKKTNCVHVTVRPHTSLFSTVFYSSVSPFTFPFGFANRRLLIHTFLFTIWVFSFSFLPPLPICPSSYSLFSSSSAAECCSSYLCSRLGMFFLLMTSILSLPLHHLLFSVWAAHLPMFTICPPTPTHLGYSSCFTGGGGIGVGSRAGP